MNGNWIRIFGYPFVALILMLLLTLVACLRLILFQTLVTLGVSYLCNNRHGSTGIVLDSVDVYLIKLGLTFFLVHALITQPKLTLTIFPSSSLSHRPIEILLFLSLKIMVIECPFMHLVANLCDGPFKSHPISKFFTSFIHLNVVLNLGIKMCLVITLKTYPSGRTKLNPSNLIQTMKATRIISWSSSGLEQKAIQESPPP